MDALRYHAQVDKNSTYLSISVRHLTELRRDCRQMNLGLVSNPLLPSFVSFLLIRYCGLNCTW